LPRPTRRIVVPRALAYPADLVAGSSATNVPFDDEREGSHGLCELRKDVVVRAASGASSGLLRRGWGRRRVQVEVDVGRPLGYGDILRAHEALGGDGGLCASREILEPHESRAVFIQPAESGAEQFELQCVRHFAGIERSRGELKPQGEIAKTLASARLATLQLLQAKIQILRFAELGCDGFLPAGPIVGRPLVGELLGFEPYGGSAFEEHSKTRDALLIGPLRHCGHHVVAK